MKSIADKADDLLKHVRVNTRLIKNSAGMENVVWLLMFKILNIL